MFRIRNRQSDRLSARRPHFAQDRRGSVHILVALMLPLLIGIVGLVVDGVNLMRVHDQLQESVDAAALAIAVSMDDAEDASNSDLPTKLKNLIAMNFRSDMGLEAEKLIVKPPVVTETDVTVEATYRQKNYVMGFFQKPFSNISVTASAMIPGPALPTPARIAMVLDNSGSMRQGSRLADLKTATRTFVNYFKDSPQTDIGFVPFAAHVNVGLSNRGANWLEVMPDGIATRQEEVCTTNYPDQEEVNCRDEVREVATYPNKTQRTREVCTTEDGHEVCRNETYWDFGDPVYVSETHEVCDIIYGDPEQSCQSVDVSTLYPWHGCVSSRGDEESDLAVMGTHKFVGLIDIVCPGPITPLTNNNADLLNAAGTMRGNGDTFIPQGVEWARIMLNPAEPLPIVNNEEKENFMVIMSDGENTRSTKDYANWEIQVSSMHAPFAWLKTKRVGLHDQTKNPKAGMAADVIMRRRCELAKADGIEIFTVALGIPEGSRGYEALRGCASKDENHFAFSDSGDLTAAFEQIAGEIAQASKNVRLTK